MHQKTLRSPCHIHGTGLHSGQEARIALLPASPNHGVVFRVREQGRQVEIPARFDFIKHTKLNTTLGRGDTKICTVEHIMAALAGLEIDNVIIVTQGSEIPSMDGSAQPFVSRIMEVGRKVQPALRQYLKILAPIEVQNGSKLAGLYPSDCTEYSFLIDFENPAIKTQSYHIQLNSQNFVSHIAKARTFGFMSELEQLKAQGLAKGAGLENAVGLNSDGLVLNSDGLRYKDEFVRHKVLDAIGDISLSGHQIIGEYRGIKSGHWLNSKLLKALYAKPDHWELVTADDISTAQAV